MNKIQQLAIQEALEAVTKALNAGIDPDALMQSIIRKSIEVVRGRERSVGGSPQVAHVV
jgi:hypothetical protein